MSNSYDPSGSSLQGTSQARILEWVAISFSRGSYQPRNQIRVSCTGRQILYHGATREDNTCVYVCVYTHIHIYMCVYMCVYIHIYIYVCVYMCVCVYINIHQSFCCTARTQYCKSTILRVFSCITKMTECPLPSTVKP